MSWVTKEMNESLLFSEKETAFKQLGDYVVPKWMEAGWGSIPTYKIVKAVGRVLKLKLRT